MRGIPSLITDIRKKVFTEVARMAYSGDYTDMEDIPFKIVPGQSPLHRESVFLERAIADARAQGRRGLVLTCKDRLVHYYAKFGFVSEGVSASTHGGVVWYQMRLTF